MAGHKSSTDTIGVPQGNSLASRVLPILVICAGCESLASTATADGATLVGLSSCMTHGGSGEDSIEFCKDLAGYLTDPRVGGVTKLRVDLNAAPSGTVAYTIWCRQTTLWLEGAAAAGPGPLQVTVDLSSTPLPESDICIIALTGAAHGAMGFRTALGDLDQSGSLNGLDSWAVADHYNETLDVLNFWFDFDRSGEITAGDSSQVRFFYGQDVPGCAVCGACCLGGSDCVDCSSDYCQNQLGGTFLGVGEECPTQRTEVEVEEPSGNIVTHVIDKALDCGGGEPRRFCTPGTPIDAWTSPANSAMCHNFGAPDADPVPAGFFGPGSDPFTGSVCLQGVPLGPTSYGDFGEADTLIERQADPFGRCDFPDELNPVTVDIQIVALSLEGLDPIAVTYGNPCQDPEMWTATVDLSLVHTDGDPGNDPPIGALTAIKTHCNGGTYTSILYVQPRFTFTKVGDPSEVRVLDAGLAGGNPLILDATATPHDWLTVPDQNLVVSNPICTDFHPATRDGLLHVTCDCNSNGVHDRCDLDGAFSSDCNENMIPDECEIPSSAGPGYYCYEPEPLDPPHPDEYYWTCDPDCNGNQILDGCEADCDNNGIPDECDPDCDADGLPDACETDPLQDDSDGDGICNGVVIAGCTPGDPTCADCNGNGIPDRFDPLIHGTKDCNLNVVPDECELLGNDCNSNGVPDDCELQQDCNTNLIPDECDLIGNDCDSNGIPDECDPDCNSNGTPDGCEPDPLLRDCDGDGICNGDEIAGCPPLDPACADCNSNGIPDECELASGDCNTNGIPDECEPFEDCNTNGIPDECELATNDCNTTGVPDDCEPFVDCNTNSIPDECELAGNDCNTNDVPDDCELLPDCNTNNSPDECDLVGNDCNTNSIPDDCEPQEDCNTNCLQDICDLAARTSTDCNGNGVPDECELAGNDCNTNDVPDDCEPQQDCNTNNIQDICDLAAGTSLDCNGTGVPDECELAGNDCNTNSVPDECEADCNTNGIADPCDLLDGTSLDCQPNGIPDECDIAGSSTDVNLNAVPDECEDCVAPPGSGDYTSDGQVYLDDHAEFPSCMSGPGQALGVGCAVFDMDGNCHADLADFARLQWILTLPQACCHLGLDCRDEPPPACTIDGGTPQGAGTVCASTICPQACCFDDGGCQNLTPSDCATQGGDAQGALTECSSLTCPQPQACCLGDGTCLDLPVADCASSNGTAQGVDSDCASTPCPQPQACCYLDAPCQNQLPENCSTNGGTPQGSATTCATLECPQACCLFDGSCDTVTPADCNTGGGIPQGAQTSCLSVVCPPMEACCYPDGSCTDEAPDFCTNGGGTAQGSGTDCFTTQCPPPSPPSITEVLSLADHIGVGALPLGVVPPAAQVIEPRTSGISRVKITFSEPMDQASAENLANISVTGAINGAQSVDSAVLNPSTVLTIHLPPPPDEDCYTFDLTGMVSAAQLALVDPTFEVLALEGDVNADEIVSSFDFVEVNLHAGEVPSVGAGTAAVDCDLSGLIGAGDLAVIQSLENFGTAASCGP